MDEKYLELKPYFANEFRRMDEDPSYKGKFNFFAFLFNFWWFIFKGCIATAFIFWGICMAAGFASGLIGGILAVALEIPLVYYLIVVGVGLAIEIVVGLKANSIYYKNYKAKRGL